jgi:ubiquinol-cytochrome c reductase cytochrome c subunit
VRNLLLIGLVALPIIVTAQTGGGNAGDANAGKGVYMEKNCYYCHGTVGQGGRDGARLANTAMNADGLIRYVRKPAGAMPAYTEKLISDQELRDILAYLKSLPAAKAPKDIPLLNQMSEK